MWSTPFFSGRVEATRIGEETSALSGENMSESEIAAALWRAGR